MWVPGFPASAGGAFCCCGPVCRVGVCSEVVSGSECKLKQAPFGWSTAATKTRTTIQREDPPRLKKIANGERDEK